MRQQPLTHWSMPTHAASLSPFLVPLTPRGRPHSFRERSPVSVRRTTTLAAFLSLSLPTLPLFSSLALFLLRSSLSLYLPPDPSNPLPLRLSLSLSPLYLSPPRSFLLSFPPQVSTLLRCGSRASDGPTARRGAERNPVPLSIDPSIASRFTAAHFFPSPKFARPSSRLVTSAVAFN